MAKSYMKLDGNLVPISVGTVGAIPKEEQTKTVATPNFSSGNVVVTADTNKVMTQVTIVKDSDLIPENIVKDVNIFGVVGTAETGGGGVDLSKLMLIAFELYVSKPNSNYSLSYSISSTMLDKRFFFDINGNSYLPSEVSVYISGNTYKGKANQNMVLYSATGNLGSTVSFKVGAITVGLPMYYYQDYGIIPTTEGFIEIKWSSYDGTRVAPVTNGMSIIQVPNDLFDNFPYYDELDYWNAKNMFAAMSPYNNSNAFKVGWDAVFID